MDVGKQRGGARHKFEKCREHSTWSMVAYQHQLKEQNAMDMNRKLLHILAERDAAIEERDQALHEKNRALEERETAMLQRNLAIKERNDAINERDNALNALQESMRQPLSSENRRRTNRLANLTYVTHEMEILNAFCRTVVESECNMSPQPKKEDSKGCVSQPRKYRQADSQIMGLNRLDYDGSIMPAPGLYTFVVPWQLAHHLHQMLKMSALIAKAYIATLSSSLFIGLSISLNIWTAVSCIYGRI